jgi:2'-5' RNA ligase
MKKRIFLAVDISGEVRKEATDFIKKLREGFSNLRVGWDKPEKLHLTMKFLGEIDEEQLKKLQSAVEAGARQIAPFKLQIAGTGVFPSPKQARVLWLGVKGDTGNLQLLNEILENECEKQGFEKEERKFKAHLTVARLKERSAELVEAHLNSNFEPVEFDVSEVVIYQSELKPTGSIYSIISKHKLRND